MQHTTSIEKIIHGGLGLCRLDSGIVCLVPYTAPGEKVLIREIEKHRGYILAEPVKILDSSPDRVEPHCPWYYQCGGCDLQHLNNKAQLLIKEMVVKESLQRAGLTIEKDIFQKIIPSPQDFHYRYRIRLKVAQTGAVGFYRANSNDLVEIDSCPVATERINIALEEFRHSKLLAKTEGTISEIEFLQSPADNKIFCLFHGLESYSLLQKQCIDKRFKNIDVFAIRDKTSTKFFTQGEQEPYLCQDFEDIVYGQTYSLQWSPGCFSQINLDQNAVLVKLACDRLGNVNTQHILDLYCGMGNFSIPLALQGSIVTGIEHDQESIDQARRNASRLQIKNTSFIARDVHKWLRKASKHPQHFDAILIDPPRQGVGKSISHLADLEASKILNISCDPATLSRDIRHLTDHGYILTNITPIDMFPQTHHIESIALLEKN